MSDGYVNGGQAPMADMEMKDEGANESTLDGVQAEPDLTDPNPPPQAALAASISIPEQLPVAQPVPQAAATPPTGPSTNSRPDSMPPQPSARPEKPVAHGGPTRQYLNSHVTPHLLEGMKSLAVYEPQKPLLWLSEFLREKSKEIEGP